MSKIEVSGRLKAEKIDDFAPGDNVTIALDPVDLAKLKEGQTILIKAIAHWEGKNFIPLWTDGENNFPCYAVLPSEPEKECTCGSVTTGMCPVHTQLKKGFHILGPDENTMKMEGPEKEKPRVIEPIDFDQQEGERLEPSNLELADKLNELIEKVNLMEREK